MDVRRPRSSPASVWVDDRGGLGHPVADGHLGHPHLVHHPLHHRNRARRAGHDAGPQTGQVVGAEVRQSQLGDEHGRHAVQGRTALSLNRLQGQRRIEARRRNDHRRPVRGAAQVAHAHPEAVVVGHRDTHPICFGVAAALADEEPVVEQIVMGQSRTLREPGGARGVLDVDRVVRRELPLPRREQSVIGRPPRVDQPIPGRVPDEDHVTKIGTVAAYLGHHRAVVAGLELRRADQHRDAGLPQDVRELVRPVRRIDVDHDRAELGGAELNEHPLRTIGRPDAYPLALDHPQIGEAERTGVDLVDQFRIAEPTTGHTIDQRLMVADAVCRPIEVGTDGVAEQRHRGDAIGVRRHGGCVAGRSVGIRLDHRRLRVPRECPDVSLLQASRLVTVWGAGAHLSRRQGPAPRIAAGIGLLESAFWNRPSGTGPPDSAARPRGSDPAPDLVQVGG